MPARRRKRKEVIQREPTPPPPEQQWDDTEDEEEEEEDCGRSEEDENGRGREIGSNENEYDPRSLEDADIIRALMNIWEQVLNSTPDPDGKLLEYRHSHAGLTPLSIPLDTGNVGNPTHTNKAPSLPTAAVVLPAHPNPHTAQAAHNESSVQQALESSPNSVLTPASSTEPQPTIVTADGHTPSTRRSGLRSKDKLRLTERANKLYRY